MKLKENYYYVITSETNDLLTEDAYETLAEAETSAMSYLRYIADKFPDTEPFSLSISKTEKSGDNDVFMLCPETVYGWRLAVDDCGNLCDDTLGE